MLRLEDVTLTVGTRELLEGATLHVHPGDRVGLVGPNGAGKTTLLRLLVGELQAERGTVVRRAGASIGWLPQQAVSGSTATVWDEVQSRMTQMQALRAQLQRAESDLAAGIDGAVERLGVATDAWSLAGGYALDERVGTVLHGLGFAPDAWQRTCDTFSGGWQMRIALARLLLADPDILLLDEPTNHLDITARSWLARFLADLGRTMVVVSHDRWLLDQVTTRTAEIRHRKLHVFKGNLSAWLVERELREQQLEAAMEKQQGEIDKLERFIERFGAKATKAAQAQSKAKALDRIERIDAPERDSRPRFRLPEAPGSSMDMVELVNVSVGWEEPSGEAGPDVLRSVELLLRRGHRVAVLGPNGAGKSTLLHAITGALPLRTGRRKLGKDVRIGVFRQDLAQALPKDRTPVEHVLLSSPSALPERARAALGALGLRGDDAMRPIGGLSGGEKARVVLAAFALQPYNLLLLDEPTNHLDAVTVDVLVDALGRFEGGMIFVTHDRFLVERVATHIVRIEGDRAICYEGVRKELLEPPPPPTSSRAGAVTEAALDHEARKRTQRERQRLQKQYERLFAEAEKVEADMAGIDARLMETGSDYQAATKLSVERKAKERRLEAIFEELATIEGQLAEA